MLESAVIARHVLAKRLSVKPQTIAKWERSWFPAPIQRVSDRLILYSLAEVEEALQQRAARTTVRVLRSA
jgi:hypothetical protein